MAAIPRRVKLRPTEDLWSDTEPLTLQEAAALLFPSGLYTASTLRTCYRQNLLETTLCTRKLTTTKKAVREMLEAARKPARRRR